MQLRLLLQNFILSFLIFSITLPSSFQQIVFLAPTTSIPKEKNGSSRYFTARDEAQIHYKVKGNPNAKQAMVMIHGFAADASHWLRTLRQHPDLEENFKIILITLRGYGVPGERKSELGKVKEGDYYATVSGDINEIMEREGIEKAIVWGHSMGGKIARKFHVLFPHRVAGLILVASVVRFPFILFSRVHSSPLIARGVKKVILKLIKRTLNSKKRLSKIETWLRAKKEEDIPLIVKKIMQEFLSWFAFRKRDAEALLKEYLHIAMSGDVEAALLGILEMGNSEKKYKQNPPIPTLIIHGDEDDVTPVSEAYLLKKMIPHAVLAIIERRRHFPHLSVRRLRPILKSFLPQFLPQVFETSC